MDIHLEYTRISVSLQENDGQSHRKMGKTQQHKTVICWVTGQQIE